MLRFVGIDPGTTTGLVIFGPNGEVLRAEDIKGEGKPPLDAKQLVSLENELYKRLRPEDEVSIESPAVGTQKGVTTGMIHGGLQSMVVRKGLAFNLVNPTWTKKYVGVTGWTGEKGSKRRLNDKEKKAAVKEAVLEHFDWTHKNHNVVDAYIIARIAYNLYRVREYLEPIDTNPYQLEVIQSVLDQTEI